MDARTIMAAARVLAAQAYPYFAHALFALKFVESKACPTMAVSATWRMYYSPTYVMNQGAEKCAAVLVHEALHVLFLHHRRAEAIAAQPMAWNLAADAEINSRLRKGPLKLPDNVIYPETFGFDEGLVAEAYYDLLMKQAQQSKSGQGQGQGQGQGEGQGQGQGGGDDQQQQPPFGGGSGTTGKPAPWETEEPSSGGGGDEGEGEGQKPGASEGASDGEGDKTPKPASTEHRVPMPSEVEMMQRLAAKDAKSCGNAPEGIKRWADELLTSKIDWRKLLAQLVKTAIVKAGDSAETTYNRMNRRSTGKVVLPSRIRSTVQVTFIVDTSGSMTQKNLEGALRECAAILRATRQPITVFACDTAAEMTKNVMKVSQVNLTGGGGTDMRVPIDAALALKGVNRPNVIVVATDGYTPWHDAHPDPNVTIIVVLIPPCADSGPSYGRTIVAED